MIKLYSLVVFFKLYSVLKVQILLLFNKYKVSISICPNAKWSCGRAALYILLKCDLLQVVADAGEFCLILDYWTHGTLFHTKSTKTDNLKTCDCRKGDFCTRNENVRSETASDPHYQIGYKTTINDRILMKWTPNSVLWIVVSISNWINLKDIGC